MAISDYENNQKEIQLKSFESLSKEEKKELSDELTQALDKINADSIPCLKPKVKKLSAKEKLQRVINQATGGIKLTQIEFDFLRKNNLKVQDAFREYESHMDHQRMLRMHRKKKKKKRRK